MDTMWYLVGTHESQLVFEVQGSEVELQSIERRAAPFIRLARQHVNQCQKVVFRRALVRDRVAF